MFGYYYAVDEDLERGIRYEFQEFDDRCLFGGFYFIYPDEDWIR